MSNPSLKLASKIVSRFVAENLLSTDEEEGVAHKLASGSISAEDWKVIAEKALMEKERASTVEEDADAAND